MIRRLKTLFVALLTVVSTAAALVPAHADVVLKTDPDDSPSYLDIKQQTAGHGKGARLQHSVTTFEPWSSRRLGDCTRFHLQFPDAHRVIAISWRGGELKARMDNPWISPAPTIGYPKVWRTDARTVMVSFQREKLGDVGESYKWRAVTWTPREGCPKDHGSAYRAWIDAARNRYSYIHRL